MFGKGELSQVKFLNIQSAVIFRMFWVIFYKLIIKSALTETVYHKYKKK